MDGTHIHCNPSAEDQHAARNCKGGVSQNCLACVSFSMRFLYFLSGWEGFAADATMYATSRLVDLTIPEGKYYLVDAGFGICNALLVPYHGICYHLLEWGWAQLQPANKEELYNLRHSSARNVVERVFGVLKKHWGILTHPPQFSMSIQAQIPPALAATHNFIMDNDPHDIDNYLTSVLQDDLDPNPRVAMENEFGTLANQAVSRAEKDRAALYWDQISQAMWDNYQARLRTVATGV